MQGRTLTDDEAEATRGALVAASLVVLERDGRDACSLRRVAQEAGMSRSTPYTYFADKEALIEAARAAAVHALADACEGALAGARDAPGRLAAVGAAYLRFALERPALYDLAFEAASPSQARREAASRYRALAEAPLREASARGWLRLPPERVADVLWAATHGLVALARSGRLDGPGTFEALRRDLADVLAFGFTAPGAPR